MIESPFEYILLDETKTIPPEIKALLDISTRSQAAWAKAAKELKKVSFKQNQDYFEMLLADMWMEFDNLNRRDVPSLSLSREVNEERE